MIDSAPRPLTQTRTQKLKSARAPVSAAAARVFGSGSEPTTQPVVVAGYAMDGAPKLIPVERVCDMLGLKRSAVHAKVASGELPAPIKFGTSRRAAARWLEHEIVAYVLAKAAARTPPSAPDAPTGSSAMS